jgi:hypothetical protein
MENKVDLIHTSTKTRINEKWLLNSNHLIQVVNDFPSDEKILNFVDTFTQHGMDSQLFQQGFLQIVTETTYHYPVTFFSEKTTKPILNKRPFVIVGSVGSLSNLKTLGFKTFSNFWNEDYDNILDPSDRIMAIFDIVQSVCNLSVNELQTLCVEMSDVLNYNFNYYVNDFKKTQMSQFEAACVKNLQPRYDSY